MDAERWRRLDALFQNALDRAPAERPAYLAEQCADDPTLRDEVEAMLEADEGAPEPMDDVRSDRLADIVMSGVDGAVRDPSEGSDAPSTDPLPFPLLGPYRLIEELGRGGLATVYLAERDDEEFSMEVAVKLVRRGLDTPPLLERLRLERQILARLEHPNIARLIDGGTAPDGRPYFVMERIEGERIDLWCERRGLDLRGRIELFRKVCDAVQTAHNLLVLHRDVKPSNILVTENGEPKLLDFGIAKLLDAADEQASVAPGFTTLTDTGMRLLTPEFASPEQVRGEALTTASDVYSLGVLLYLLVTGERPYEFDRGRPAEIERIICEVEPRRPSAVVWNRAPDDPGSPTRRSLGWPRRPTGDDLDTILREALRKEPELRYGSVTRLSNDLRAYLADLPISARPDTMSYVAGKFFRRHRGPAIAALLLVLALMAGVITTTRQARVARSAQERAELRRAEAEEQREIADLQRRRAEEATVFLVDLFDVSDPFRTGGERQQTTARELLDRGADRIAGRLGDDPLLRASLMATIGRVYRNLTLLDGRLLAFAAGAERVGDVEEVDEEDRRLFCTS
ncbi:MAG: serine/threonine-protein kinase, partial [Acidobacteriota bacterium]